MSTRSQFAFAALDAGIRVEENQAEWLGTPEACWDAYVASWATATCDRLGCDVYWIEATCGEQTYWKIGISQDAEKRMKDFAKTFPIASWRILRRCRMARRPVAERCEADMLVACRHLHIDGEWIRTG